ncbi:MAG: indole-3-glycerol phosphate synthase TrpC [Actinomycetota bacterium]|nr:indole-3-glycerol phosphate synthase TrpC [Actinomycetota bacterium]
MEHRYAGVAVPTYLDDIVAAHRASAREDNRPFDRLIEAASRTAPPRAFASALVSEPEMSVIAEIKRRSPSRGDLAPGLVAEVLAKAYADGGATCLSVLTDRQFFAALPDDLPDARAAVDLPLLRKDFIVSAHDVCDARLMGADAVLLIVAALDDDELATLHDLAAELGMDVLVEVHDEAELDRALAVGATLVGVNQRDLSTFEVDARRALRMAAVIPEDVVKVAESGIAGPDDAARLHDAGYDAILVGESLVTHHDPAAAVRELRLASCS